MAKALLVEENGIRTINIPVEDNIVTIDEMRKVTNIDLFDVVNLDDGIDIWVDDEGLLQSGNFVHRYTYDNTDGDDFTIKLAGKALILGNNEEGDALGLTDMQIKKIVAELKVQRYGLVQ